MGTPGPRHTRPSKTPCPASSAATALLRELLGHPAGNCLLGLLCFRLPARSYSRAVSPRASQLHHSALLRFGEVGSAIPLPDLATQPLGHLAGFRSLATVLYFLSDPAELDWLTGGVDRNPRPVAPRRVNH